MGASLDNRKPTTPLTTSNISTSSKMSRTEGNEGDVVIFRDRPKSSHTAYKFHGEKWNNVENNVVCLPDLNLVA
jgi:signal peptidase I